MNYKECREYLDRLNREKGMIMGTKPIRNILMALDYPEKSTKIIHVAGTNGKGSVSAFLSGIISEAGYTVGRYVSPAVIEYNEIVQYVHDGSIEYITDEEIAEYISYIAGLPGADKLTGFEVETVMALLSFRERGCDYAIIECGLGGIDDATNAITSKEMCVFTSISMDHMSILGNTVEEIAAAKAGILRNGVKAVSALQTGAVTNVLDRYAAHNNTIITYASKCTGCEYNITGTYFNIGDNRYHIKLPGVYQPDNASTAITAARVLFGEDNRVITEEIIDRALNNAVWRGRFTVLSQNPYIIIDGAHNVDGIFKLRQSIDTLFDREMYYRIGIMGVFRDKDVYGMVNIIADTFDEIHTVRAPSPRGIEAEVLADIIAEITDTAVITHTSDTARVIAAEQKTRQYFDNREPVIVIFGSLSLVRE